MRVIYKILLGLLLFNAFLTLYGPLFNTSLSDNAIDYESEDMQQYKLDSVWDIIGLIFSTENLGALAAGGIAMTAAMLVAFATKNYVLIGVGLFVAIVIGLYMNMSTIIFKIGTTYGAFTINGIEYNIILGLMTIVGIAIGLIVVFGVMDMFAPASARE